MKRILGITGMLIILALAFLALNFIWKWVHIDLLLLGKSGLTLLVVALVLVLLFIIWYIFIRRAPYKPLQEGSRAQRKDS